LLHLPAQLELELAERLDDVGLERCGSRSIAFHAPVGESFELFDHFIEPRDIRSGCAPLTPQLLSFVEALAYLSGKLPRIAQAVSSAHHCRTIRTKTLLIGRLCLTAVLSAAGLLSTLLLSFLSVLLSALAFLALLALLTLLLTLLIALLLSLLLPLLLPVATRSSFVQTAAQGIEVVGKLPGAIKVLFCTRAIGAAGALFRCLQTFGNVVETAFDSALVRAARALLTVVSLLTVRLLTILLLTIRLLTILLLTVPLLAVQRLLTFTNPVGHTIAS
jgi:hypothetical protein